MVTPEIKLLACVLFQAIRDATSYGDDSSTARREARNWLGTTGNRKPFKKKKGDYIHKDWSFEWICEHIDLNPHVVREEIIKVQMEKSSPVTVGLKVGLEAYMEKVYNGEDYSLHRMQRVKQGMS